MAVSPEHPVVVRAAVAGDREAVLELLGASLGWRPDQHLSGFFQWKHDENPFGRSPGWVATEAGTIVGFRTFLRWEFEGDDGRVHRAVRAVDTATHPSRQGRGIFRRLTEAALLDVASDGVEMVFNTPNAQSRPGYLRMGWTEVGRPRAAVRLTSLASPLRMVNARVAAERWSVPTDRGRPAAEVLSDHRLDDLVASLVPASGLRTHRTAEYLRWRYRFEPLSYRVVTLSPDVAEGVAVWRLRRRGSAVECALCEVLVPADEPRASRALVRRAVRSSGADYVIRLGGRAVDRAGFIALPRLGPILTWRPLTPATRGGTTADWDLTLGDIELF